MKVLRNTFACSVSGWKALVLLGLCSGGSVVCLLLSNSGELMINLRGHIK